MSKTKSIPIDLLWGLAKSGQRKLTASERRRVLIYLEDVGESQQYTNHDLAKIFQVSDTVIHLDKKRILTTYADSLTPDQAMQFVARQLKDIETLITTAKKGLQKNETGTLGERFYIDTLKGLYKERFSIYQEVGIVKKELGSLNISEEKWVATVDVDTGECGVHRDDTNE